VNLPDHTNSPTFPRLWPFFPDFSISRIPRHLVSRNSRKSATPNNGKATVEMYVTNTLSEQHEYVRFLCGRACPGIGKCVPGDKTGILLMAGKTTDRLQGVPSHAEGSPYTTRGFASPKCKHNTLACMLPYSLCT